MHSEIFEISALLGTQFSDPSFTELLFQKSIMNDLYIAIALILRKRRYESDSKFILTVSQYVEVLNNLFAKYCDAETSNKNIKEVNGDLKLNESMSHQINNNHYSVINCSENLSPIICVNHEKISSTESSQNKVEDSNIGLGSISQKNVNNQNDNDNNNIDMEIIEMSQTTTTKESLFSQESVFDGLHSISNGLDIPNKIDSVFDNIDKIQNDLRKPEDEFSSIISNINHYELTSCNKTQLWDSRDPILMVNKQASSPTSKDGNEILSVTNEIHTQQISSMDETEATRKDQADVHQKILEIKRGLIRLNKQSLLTYLQIKKQLIGMFKTFLKLSKIENLKYNEKNQLSTPFLKLFLKIFQCSNLTDKKLHELFKLLINCYVLNFKIFTKSDKFQYSLIFQLIFDLIFIHSTVKIKNSDVNLNSSYYLKFTDHKIKNQLTLVNDERHIHILLYYLIQLLFLTINWKAPTLTFSEKQYLSEYLRKLMAFLIVNNNIELLRLFHKNRKQLNIL